MSGIERLSSKRLLARLLETPNLPDYVRALPASDLYSLIESVGLEDASELVSFASTEQLVEIFDVDLWKNTRAGEEETFDEERFGLWIEILQEAGDELLASRLADLPEEFLTFALHSQRLVLDLDVLGEDMNALAEEDEDAFERLDKALGDCLGEELDHYRLVARRPEGWDAVLSAVLALDRDHSDLLQRVLRRCAHMSASYIEANDGLYEVLTAAESLADDIAGEREERRAAAGYVAPLAAKSFLALARERMKLGAARDPVTKAYFRDLKQDFDPTSPGEGVRQLQALVPTRAPEARSNALLDGMRALAAADPDKFAERREEIAYLVNVLVAAGTLEGRRVRPVEALRAVVKVHDYVTRINHHEKSSPLVTRGADELFRLAWARLHEEAARSGHTHDAADLDVLTSISSRGIIE